MKPLTQQHARTCYKHTRLCVVAAAETTPLGTANTHDTANTHNTRGDKAWWALQKLLLASPPGCCNAARLSFQTAPPAALSATGRAPRGSPEKALKGCREPTAAGGRRCHTILLPVPCCWECAPRRPPVLREAGTRTCNHNTSTSSSGSQAVRIHPQRRLHHLGHMAAPNTPHAGSSMQAQHTWAAASPLVPLWPRHQPLAPPNTLLDPHVSKPQAYPPD